VAHRRVSVSDPGTARRTAPRRPRSSVTATLLLATVVLLLAFASADARSTRPGADRLRISAERDQLSLDYGAVVTATGTIGLSADVTETERSFYPYVGRVILTALPRSRRCPRSAPRTDPSHSDSDDLREGRFSETLAIAGAFEVARKLRLCGYLTSKRRTPSGIRTVTVARASTTLTGPVEQESAGDDDELERVFGAIVALIFVIGFIAAIVYGCGWLFSDTPSVTNRSAKSRRPRQGPSAPPCAAPPPAAPPPAAPRPAAPAPYGVSASPPPQSTPIAAPPQPAPAQAARPRRRAKPRDVILDAADKVADSYRDRLQNILEHQDGPGWLDAFNDRRAASFIQDGKPAPRPYDALEPRAVLNCLARDPAGLQLISEAATAKARQLSGLVNDAVHPRPHAPLTEADGYRAWPLYTDITGIVAVGDPFDR
jgi:pyruvate/2-oxoglutarate dehydrogenase complex dihydrolipoamide acyltransferase (E2) component